MLPVRAVASVENDQQRVRHQPMLQIVVGVDVDVIVSLICADMGYQHLIKAVEGLQVEIQPAIRLADLVGEGDVLRAQLPLPVGNVPARVTSLFNHINRQAEDYHCLSSRFLP